MLLYGKDFPVPITHHASTEWLSAWCWNLILLMDMTYCVCMILNDHPAPQLTVSLCDVTMQKNSPYVVVYISITRY